MDPREGNAAPQEAAEPPLRTSVVIVSRNCLERLRQCLTALEASVARETFEILVVDNGSQDGSGQVDEDFPRVTVLRLPRHFGLTKARNIAVRTAKGEFLLLLQPDVEVRPDTVAALSERLGSNEDTLAVCPLLVDPGGEPVSRAGPLPTLAAVCASWPGRTPWYASCPALKREDLGDSPIRVECPDPRAVLIRARFVRGMNYFDERYGEFGSELDWITRAWKASRPVILLPAVQAVCHGGDGLWRPRDDAGWEALEADFAAGLATYARRHYGWAAALKLQIRMALRALTGLRFGLFSKVLSGGKIDGSQTAF
jgi:GT2 family glycosyltransferase